MIRFGLNIFFSASLAIGQTSATMPSSAPASAPAAFQVIGRIDSPAIPESSGIVESRRYPGVFWTHNDSGNPAELFAISREGKLIARFPVGTKNVDWEDIAIDDQGHLYLADIGNNLRQRREIQVYRISEPDPRSSGRMLAVEQAFYLTYPALPFDAESLFLIGDSAYIISKHLDFQPAGIYRFDLTKPAAPQVLSKVVDLPTRMPVTAADLSRDGKLLAIMSLVGPSVYRIDGDITNVRNGAIWSATFVDPNVEGICFVKDGLLATTEGRRVIFFPFAPAAPATRP